MKNKTKHYYYTKTKCSLLVEKQSGYQMNMKDTEYPREMQNHIDDVSSGDFALSIIINALINNITRRHIDIRNQRLYVDINI